MRIHGAEQVPPFARDPDKRLIPVPSRRFRLDRAAQTPVDLRAVCLDPAPNWRMIDGQAPLCHEFFQIAEAQSEPQIPPHTVTMVCGSNFLSRTVAAGTN